MWGLWLADLPMDCGSIGFDNPTKLQLSGFKQILTESARLAPNARTRAHTQPGKLSFPYLEMGIMKPVAAEGKGQGRAQLAFGKYHLRYSPQFCQGNQ